MIRKAFTMYLKKGMIDEYKREHNPIPKELCFVLKKYGICNYSIFYNENNNHLFGYLEVDDNSKFIALAKEKVCQEWWLKMKRYLVAENDYSLKAKEEELCEIFHID